MAAITTTVAVRTRARTAPTRPTANQANAPSSHDAPRHGENPPRGYDPGFGKGVATSSAMNASRSTDDTIQI
jgi:hypothetical protein